MCGRKKVILLLFLNVLYVHCKRVLMTQNINEIDSLHLLEEYDRAPCRCVNGQCVEEGGKKICKCSPGFGNITLTTCKACECGPDATGCMWTQSSFSGEKKCFCKPGYSQKSKICVACDCGPESSCTFTGFWGIKTCICKQGYKENGEKCVGPCNPTPCKNGGVCKDAKNGYECICTSKYTGKDCTENVSPCSSQPCMNGGECAENRDSFTCKCLQPYRGITCEKVPPTINKSMFQDLEVKVGQPIKFDITVSGEPPPTVTWEVNDMDVKEQNRIILENTDYNTKLTILQGIRNDSGRYTLIAENENGKDTATVSVLVVGVPLPPSELEVTDVHTEGCKLKWNKPIDDGGVPLQHYKVEMIQIDEDSITVSYTNQTEMEFTDLTPGKTYTFRVTAVNEEGESDPLEITQLIPIIVVPGQPSKPQIIDWNKDHVDLKLQSILLEKILLEMSGRSPFKLKRRKQLYRILWKENLMYSE